MIQALRVTLAEVGQVLEGKHDDVFNLFDGDELKAYFRTLDSIRVLIPALHHVEQAMYKNKMLFQVAQTANELTAGRPGG